VAGQKNRREAPIMVPGTFYLLNVAVFVYNGVAYEAASDYLKPGDDGHAEKELFSDLQKQFGASFNPSNITMIYSELQICSSCENWLIENGIPQSVVLGHTYSWKYPSQTAEHTNSIRAWYIQMKLI
jgi:Xanthomonas XOO_2897-like deaminase